MQVALIFGVLISIFVLIHRLMDLLTTGILEDADILFSECCLNYEELELLTGGGETSSGVDSPSSESGIVSPSTLLDEDILDTSVINVPVCTPSLCKEDVKPLVQSQPKLKLHHNGQKLSDHQMERNRKNAIAARINRQKKKEYLSGLENKITSLSTENKTLKEKCDSYEATIHSLEDEIEYLKSVLANQSTLSTILTGLPNIKCVSVAGKRKREGSESTNKKVKKDSPQHSGGICLHIAGDVASIELCSKCSLRCNH